jgi:cellulose synthase/poly-beta-1,6-N-acetylglucosamine synthase-like glycosyltransferase
MAHISEAAFWVLVFLIVYTYVGYPLLVRLLAQLIPHPVRRAPIRPRVSIIIAAYNEEKVIAGKIANTFALEYPKEQLEIIIVTDGSSDRTPEIAREFQSAGVEVLHQPERAGKIGALNRAVPRATGEIVLFSDANTIYSPKAVDMMVRNFGDETVGGVCGRKIILKDSARATTRGEGAYWSYEAALKTAESLVGSITTADGEIFAIRKELFEPFPPDIVHDDMFLTLRIIEKGYRVVYENDATSAEYASRTFWDEFHLKVRYASAGYQIVSRFRRLLAPPRTWMAFCFLSHKLLRWMAAFFLVAALVSSGLAPNEPFYRVAFLAQVGFYALAVAGWATARISSRIPFLYFPFYFSAMNAAALYGLLRHLFGGGQTTLWRKAAR